MSERAMIRAHSRAAARRARRRVLGVAVGATAALAAAAASAPAASAIEVNSLADPGDGTCDASCTLRDAIDAADSTPATADTITFKSGLSGTTVLNSAVGQLTIYSPMSIQGPGANQVTISGDTGLDGTPETRLLYVNSDGVSISGLTLTSGNGKPNASGSSAQGGAIYEFNGGLTLDHVVVSNSKATNGGGIWSDTSNLTITNSTIVGNTGDSGGGGIFSFKGSSGSHSTSLVVRNSTITGNTVPVTATNGGGIAAGNIGALEIDHSTISGNGSPLNGGGITAAVITGPAKITDSTITGNSAVRGGGVFLGDSFQGITIQNSTIAGNSLRTTGPSPSGGGVYLGAAIVGPMTISSSIVADNTPTDLASKASALPLNLGFSLVENPATATLQQSPAGSNLLGVDPQLAPLGANGGPTQTQLIAPGSPAVDAGIANGLATDQRGLARTVQQPGANPSGGDGTDVGAIELPDGSVDSPNVSAKRTQKVKGSKIKIVVEVGAGEAVKAEGSGSIKAGGGGKGKGRRKGKKAVGLSVISSDVAAGSTAKLTLKPAKKSAGRKLSKQLARGGKAKASISVKLTDAAGNSATVPVSVKLKGAKKKG